MAFTNKVFFITGAANGLGKAYMGAVLERGGKVFFGDVNEETGNQTQHEMAGKYGSDKVKFKAFNVTDLAAFEGAFSEAVAQFRQVDVMVNNAGILNEGAWELMVKINVLGVIHGTKLAIEHMRKDKGGKGGRIINISSVAGLDTIFAASIYTCTKHAVRAYTASLALQPNIEEQGIEFGILCPGSAATDIILKLDTSKVNFDDAMIEQVKASVMPIQTVVDGFLDLVQLKNMNGAMLVVEADQRFYQTLQRVDIPNPDDPKADQSQEEAQSS